MYVFEERNIGRSWPFIVNLLLLQDTCGGVEKGNKQGFIERHYQRLALYVLQISEVCSIFLIHDWFFYIF